MKLFSGSSNIPLAKEVAKNLGVTLSAAEITRFSNSETKVRIAEEVDNQVCVVIQSTAAPADTHIFELLFYGDALKRQKAKKIVAVIPYFGYSKQDAQHEKGEAVSAEVIVRLLEAARFDKIFSVDLHSKKTSESSTVPFVNLVALDLLAHQTKKYFSEKKIGLNTVSLVVPDQGAVAQGKLFGKKLFGEQHFSIVFIDKKRSGESTHVYAVHGEITGPHILIFDDMIMNGSTLVSAVNAVEEKRDINTCTVVATHHDFTPRTLDNLKKAHIDAILSTNSINNPPQLQTPLLQEISLAPLIADELRNLIQ